MNYQIGIQGWTFIHNSRFWANETLLISVINKKKHWSFANCFRPLSQRVCYWRWFFLFLQIKANNVSGAKMTVADWLVLLLEVNDSRGITRPNNISELRLNVANKDKNDPHNWTIRAPDQTPRSALDFHDGLALACAHPLADLLNLTSDWI